MSVEWDDEEGCISFSTTEEMVEHVMKTVFTIVEMINLRLDIKEFERTNTIK